MILRKEKREIGKIEKIRTRIRRNKKKRRKREK